MTMTKTTMTCVALILVCGGGAFLRAADERPAEVKMEPLFNGKDLAGFKAPAPNPFWTVTADGILVGQSDGVSPDQKKGHVLYTEKEYGDHAIEADVRFADGIDSGFMYGKPMLQVQIGVSRSLKKDMTASIYYKGKYLGVANGVDKLLKLGDWNAIRYELKGKQTKVWLNGQHVLTYDCPEEIKPGPIGLQIHPGVAMKVEFRNLKVGEIK